MISPVGPSAPPKEESSPVSQSEAGKEITGPSLHTEELTNTPLCTGEPQAAPLEVEEEQSGSSEEPAGQPADSTPHIKVSAAQKDNDAPENQDLQATQSQSD